MENNLDDVWVRLVDTHERMTLARDEYEGLSRERKYLFEELVRSGVTYREIGERIGVGLTAVHNAVMRSR